MPVAKFNKKIGGDRKKESKSRDMEEEKKAPEPKPKKSKKFLLIIIGAVIMSGAGGWFVLFSPWQVWNGPVLLGMTKAPEPEKKPAKEAQKFIYKMDPFVVNLGDPERMRYLKLKLEVESIEAKNNEEYEKRLPQLRDLIFTILTNKTSREIMDSEGKAKLRNEIAGRLNQLLTTFQIRTVYFAEFVIQ
jgi:flagellar FliL protein